MYKVSCDICGKDITGKLQNNSVTLSPDQLATFAGIGRHYELCNQCYANVHKDIKKRIKEGKHES